MKHPACDFPVETEFEVSGLIAKKLRNAEPFSLVRIGDSEGLVLSMSDQSPQMDFEYLAWHAGPGRAFRRLVGDSEQTDRFQVEVQHGR